MPCPCRVGGSALLVLALFERTTGELFSDTPGALLDTRLRAMAKVLGNVARAEVWDPPMEKLRTRDGLLWNRTARRPVDAAAWRRAVEAAEARAGPVPRLRQQMAAADAGLVKWIKEHRWLVPTAAELGESGMALLLLWEVDHQQSYPNHGGEAMTGALVGFTKRLQERVEADPELSQWLNWKDMQTPLSAGLAPSHHRRWAVRVVAPAADQPRGWYDEFVARWRAYLELLACPSGSRPLSSVTAEQVGRIRPAAQPTQTEHAVPTPPSQELGGCQGPPGEMEQEAVVMQEPTRRGRPREERQDEDHPARKRQRPASPGQRHDPRRKRPRSPTEERSPRTTLKSSRQRTLHGWIRPQMELADQGREPPTGPEDIRHGRAVEGPPT